MYWVQMWQSWFPGSSTAVTDNDEDRVIRNVTEEEARAEVKEILNLPVPEFYYMPDEINFESVRINTDVQYARFQYICNDRAVYFSVLGDIADRTESWSPDSEKIDTLSVKVSDGEIPIYIIEDTTGNDGTIIYRAQWIYHNCQYELSGVLEKKEMIKILEKIRYTV